MVSFTEYSNVKFTYNRASSTHGGAAILLAIVKLNFIFNANFNVVFFNNTAANSGGALHSEDHCRAYYSNNFSISFMWWDDVSCKI